MTFLAPAWLFLLVLTVPVMLLHARRQRRVEVASVRLWQMVERAASRRPHLRWPEPSPVLFLQLAAIALAALALAQPRFGESVADHTIFLLDSSGSMQATDAAPNRFAAARAALSERVGAIGGGGGRVSVIGVGAVAQLAVARQTEPAGILPLVEQIRPTDGVSDWTGAAAWIGSLLRADEHTRAVLLTDSPERARQAVAAAYPDLAIETVVFGSAETANAALAARVIPVDAAAGRWQVAGRVTLAGDADMPSGVSVHFGREGYEGDLDWGEIPLPAEDAEEDTAGRRVIPFTAELKFPGPGRLRLELPADSGPHDNRAYFVLEDAPRQVEVLLVGQADPDLVRALESAGAVEIGVADGLAANDEAFDLVVVNDVVVDQRPATNVLWMGRGRVADEPAPGALTGGDLTGWNREHMLSRQVDWTALEAPRFFPVATLAGAIVIAQSGALPLVQARTTAHGREVRMALDPAASGWSDDPGFPLFMAAVVDWLGIAQGVASAEPCVAGYPCGLEARRLSSMVTGPEGDVVFDGPDGQSGALPAGIGEAFVPVKAGFHRVGQGNGARLIAVNPPAQGEADLRVADGGAPGWSAPVKWWWWLALALLVILLAEAWIAGRGAERFLFRRDLAAERPHSMRRRAILGARLFSLACVGAALVTMLLPVLEPAQTIVAVTADTPGAGGPDARVGTQASGMVVAGATGRVARDIGENPSDRPPERGVASGANLEQAVRLAAAMIPGERTGRILLSAGGNETAGLLGRVYGDLSARGISIDALAQTGVIPAGEVLVESVSVPRRAFVGDTYRLDAMVFSQAPGAARISVLRDGNLVSEQAVDLAAGRNRIEAVLPAPAEGNSLIEVMVSSGTDRFAENNRNGAVVAVEAPASILVVAPNREWGRYFAEALDVQGLVAEVVEPNRTPQELAGWLRYDLVALMNVPARDMKIEQHEQLERAVESHGLGLLILGGENAFGPGGYYGTPLERLSPLSSRVPQEAPVAALVFVLDRSGSMQAMVEDVTRLDIVKAATAKAVGLLDEGSRVGIVAFDSNAYTVLPLSEGQDEASVSAALAPMVPGGGTELFPGLAAAIGQLEPVAAQIKHIIVMTDGLIEPVDFGVLLDRAEAADITISSVAVGTSALTGRFESIAELGGGTYYATRDFKAVPSILSEETLSLADSLVVEETRPVHWTDRDAAFLSHLPDNLPPLDNYVRTSVKPAATLHLALEDDEGQVPVLASWRYGNGRVLALATHGAGSGTQRWLEMPQYPLIWSQIARHFLPNALGPGLHVRLDRRGDTIAVTTDLLDALAMPVSGETAMARLENDRTIRLAETSPGRYEASFAALEGGTQTVEVSAGNLTESAHIHIGYPALYDFARSGAEPLIAMASATGGRVYGAGEALAPVGTMLTMKPEWRPWLLLALASFMADLLLRYGPNLAALRRRKRDVAAGPDGWANAVPVGLAGRR